MSTRLESAPLEDWLRERYFDAAADISSSGVDPYTWPELRELLDLDPNDLDAISFRDSRSAGSDELRALIAQRYQVDDPNRVIVGNGSTEAQLLVLAATLAAGDEVVVVEPAYHSLISPVRALGCRVKRWQLRPELGFRPEMEELRQLVTDSTAMVVVNFPHNPTGVTLTRSEQLELIEITRRHGCRLFWDGAFEDLVADGRPLPMPSVLDPQALSFGSMSKAFGLPGLRVGWGIVPPDVVQAAVSVRDYTTLALSPLVEFVAARALRGADRLLGPRLATVADNRALVRAWLDRNPDTVSCPGANEGAGTVIFPALRNVADTVAFCDRLMREQKVLLVPGECWNLPGHVRLGFGGDSAALSRGLDAVTSLLDSLEAGAR